jgi:tetratricopeptide (TPR) repeat protein
MLEIDPGNGELKRSLAEAYVRARKLDEAGALYDELVQAYPQNYDILSSSGVVHLLRKDYSGAERIFERLVENDSAQIEAKLRIGEAYFGQVERDSALLPVTRRLFERVRDKHPRDWRAYWFLGALGAMGNDDSAAVRNFRAVTELSSGNADAWVYLSSVFLEKNNFQEVVSILERAVRIVPDDFRVNFFLGVAYNRLGRNNEAARTLEKARQLNARDVNALGQLALVYDGMGRHEESDRLYDEALSIEPDNAVVLNNYAYSLAERNVRIERALEMAQKAVDAQPKNASFLDTIGWVFFRLEEYRQAETYLLKAIETGEVSAVVHEHLGDVYYKMKDPGRAMEQWKIALKLDEGNEALRAKIARGSL